MGNGLDSGRGMGNCSRSNKIAGPKVTIERVSMKAVHKPPSRSTITGGDLIRLFRISSSLKAKMIMRARRRLAARPSRLLLFDLDEEVPKGRGMCEPGGGKSKRYRGGVGGGRSSRLQRLTCRRSTTVPCGRAIISSRPGLIRGRISDGRGLGCRQLELARVNTILRRGISRPRVHRESWARAGGIVHLSSWWAAMHCGRTGGHDGL